LTENKIKVTSSGTSRAGVDKILKMTLTPPGGRDEGVEVKHIVERTIRNHPLIFVSGEIILGSLYISCIIIIYIYNTNCKNFPLQ